MLHPSAPSATGCDPLELGLELELELGLELELELELGFGILSPALIPWILGLQVDPARFSCPIPNPK